MLLTGIFFMMLPFLGLADDPTTTLTTVASTTVTTSATSSIVMPEVKDWNEKGSSMCKHINSDHCATAAQNYLQNSSKQYTSYTSYYDASFSLNILKTAHDFGCTTYFECDKDNYGSGMSGAQIYEAYEMLTGYGAKTCGSIYFENGCHLTANYCASCKSKVS